MEYLIGEWKGWTKRWIAAIYDRVDYELIAQALRSSFSVNAIYVWIPTRRLGQRCALCTMHVHPHTHTFYIQWIGLSNGRKKWIWKFQEYYFHFPFHFSAASACRTLVSIIIRRPFSAEKQFLPIFRTFFLFFFIPRMILIIQTYSFSICEVFGCANDMMWNLMHRREWNEQFLFVRFSTCCAIWIVYTERERAREIWN